MLTHIRWVVSTLTNWPELDARLLLMWKKNLLSLPPSGALILPIPSRQSLEQVLLSKILQLLPLFLPVEAVPKLHPGKIELKKVLKEAFFPGLVKVQHILPPVPKISENWGFRFFFIENPRLRLPEDHGCSTRRPGGWWRLGRGGCTFSWIWLICCIVHQL